MHLALHSANDALIQAILSQFDRKKRASKAEEDDAEEESDIDRQLDELDDGEPEEQEEDDDEETDESREAADAAVLESLDEENPELVLTRAEISAGQLALEKVSCIVCFSPAAVLIRRPCRS